MPINVMYLDDEKELCDNFSDIFGSNEIAVTTFTDPKAAITAAAANPPDLVFLDYRLPSTTGDNVAQAMDAKIPKFLVTGDISVVTQYHFLKVFNKPYKEEEILETIMNFARLKKVG